MAAPGAAALAHSASEIASPSSLLTPGSRQLLAPLRRRMDRGQGAGGVLRKPESGPESGPVGGAVKIAVFDHDDGLALPVIPALKSGFKS